MCIRDRIYPVLTSPVLAPGFNNVLPAVMGAMLMQRIMWNWKIGIVPFVLGLASAFIFGLEWFNAYGVWIMLVLIAITVVWAKVLHDKGVVK